MQGLSLEESAVDKLKDNKLFRFDTTSLGKDMGRYFDNR